MKTDLDLARAVADARCGALEDAAWWIAILLALAVYQRWDSWLLTIPAFVLPFWLIPRDARRRSDALWALKDPEPMQSDYLPPYL